MIEGILIAAGSVAVGLVVAYFVISYMELIADVKAIREMLKDKK